MAASGQRVMIGRAKLEGSGNLLVEGVRYTLITSGVKFGGSGNMEVRASKIHEGTILLYGSGNLSAKPAHIATGKALLLGQGELRVSGGKLHNASVKLDGSGNLIIDGEVYVGELLVFEDTPFDLIAIADEFVVMK